MWRNPWRGARASWNRRRIASRKEVDATYEAASTTNGTACPIVNSAPPTDGPATLTTADRAWSTASAVGRRRANETRPALLGECVSSSTRSGYAIDVSEVPPADSSRPALKRTKSRLRRSCCEVVTCRAPPESRRRSGLWIPAHSALSARVAEGTRTPDHRDHNPGLYQLSYCHRAGDILAALSGTA